MAMTNTQQLSIAESYIGQGGSVFRRYCGLGSGDPYCCAFDVTVFAKGGNSALFCDSRKVTYCPTAIAWCRNNLAQIPIGIAMPSDIIFFDWQPNQIPDHIGFVKESLGAVEVLTIEGNTRLIRDGKTVATGVVAERKRTAGEVQAVFRPHFPATFDLNKPLVIDGKVGYQTIAKIQQALGIPVDGILGKQTVKALQKKAGVAQDGSFGPNTTKAVQALLGVKADGLFGPDSCKALQRWAEANASGKAPIEPDPEPSPKPSKVDVDGAMGPATVIATQRLFGTVQDGVISGQLKSCQKYYPAINAVSFGGGGSILVMRLQKWLGQTQDGILGKQTVKAWQKLLGVSQDGSFGPASVKAWQRYINEHETLGAGLESSDAQKIINAADKFCWPYGTAEKKWKYSTGAPVAAYKKAAGDEEKITLSDCGYFVKIAIKDALGIKYNPLNDKTIPSKFKLIHSGKAIPDGVLQPGDIIWYKKTTGGQHTLIYYGDGKVAEAGREVRFPVIRKTKKYNADDVKKSTIKVIRVR